MALPSGQISFSDFNTDRGIAATTQIDIFSAGVIYGVPFNTFGSDDLQMNEFWGKSEPLYDVYEMCGVPGDYRFIIYQPSNAFTLQIGGSCGLKVSSGFTYNQVQNNYPTAVFYSDTSNPGCECN
jgi:hypothetical protein